MNSSGTSLAPERFGCILEQLRDRRVVKVDELSRKLAVSAATVRRDLLELEKRGLLHRVHGGAVGVDGNLAEPVFDDKAGRMRAEKRRIAEAALKHIKPRDAVYLDGGSTVLTLAGLLTGHQGLTVVTNSLRVASWLGMNGPRLIVVGGEFRRVSQTFVGVLTQIPLERLRFDTAFMGTLGLNGADGATTTDPREAFTKQIALGRARRRILLADSGKLGLVSFARFGAVGDLDLLITDRGADPGRCAELRKAGLKIETV